MTAMRRVVPMPALIAASTATAKALHRRRSVQETESDSDSEPRCPPPPAQLTLVTVAGPKQARSERTLHRLLDAAEALIAEKGLAGLSIPETWRAAPARRWAASTRASATRTSCCARSRSASSIELLQRARSARRRSAAGRDAAPADIVDAAVARAGAASPRARAQLIARLPGPRHRRTRSSATTACASAAASRSASAPLLLGAAARHAPSRPGARDRPRHPDRLRPHAAARADRGDPGRRPRAHRRRAAARDRAHVPRATSASTTRATARGAADRRADGPTLAGGRPMQYTAAQPASDPRERRLRVGSAPPSTPCFDWQYELQKQNLLDLYEKGKALAWNANDLDWSIDVDIEKHGCASASATASRTLMNQLLSPPHAARRRRGRSRCSST